MRLDDLTPGERAIVAAAERVRPRRVPSPDQDTPCASCGETGQVKNPRAAQHLRLEPLMVPCPSCTPPEEAR